MWMEWLSRHVSYDLYILPSALVSMAVRARARPISVNEHECLGAKHLVSPCGSHTRLGEGKGPDSFRLSLRRQSTISLTTIPVLYCNAAERREAVPKNGEPCLDQLARLFTTSAENCPTLRMARSSGSL